MEIQFKDEKLRKLCEQQALANKRLGALCAKKLRTRLSNLQAVNAVSELVAGNPEPLKGDRLGQFSLRLQGGMRLVFEAANEPVPRNQDGAIDWSKVTQVCIVSMENYHD